jgi:hypothetical protein
MISEFFNWWYGPGWRDMQASLSQTARRIYYGLSVATLLSTLFDPWRRIITPASDDPIAAFKAWGDNLVSRGVGAVIRLATLLVAGLCLAGIGILAVIVLGLWFVWPLAGPAMVIIGASLAIVS